MLPAPESVGIALNNRNIELGSKFNVGQRRMKEQNSTNNSWSFSGEKTEVFSGYQ